VPSPGEIWRVKLYWVPHPKFVICIQHDGDQGYYLFINSEKQHKDYQLLISPNDLNCLSHPSYIDASEVKAIGMQIIDHAHANTDLGRVGFLPDYFRVALRAECKSHKLMPGRFIKMIEANFTSANS
jgi:hypothetical protein